MIRTLQKKKITFKRYFIITSLQDKDYWYTTIMNINLSSIKQGFTLVEIMIVVVIIGFLATYGIQKMGKSKERAQAVAANNLCVKLNEGIQRLVTDDLIGKGSSNVWSPANTTASLNLLVDAMFKQQYIDAQTQKQWKQFITDSPNFSRPITFTVTVPINVRDTVISTDASSDSAIIKE